MAFAPPRASGCAGRVVGAAEKKIGWHSQPIAQVNFDEVRVPIANRVGGDSEGFRIAMMGLECGRLNTGACSSVNPWRSGSSRRARAYPLASQWSKSARIVMEHE